MTPQERKLYQQAIESYEYRQPDIRHLCGIEVIATNIRVRKTDVVANIKVRHLEEGRTESYNDCVYPKELLDGIV
jgi:hypothetical protein